LDEDIPRNHVTLKGPMIPKVKESIVYDYFFDVKDGKFKLWDTIVDTSPIPENAEVLQTSLSCTTVILRAIMIAQCHHLPSLTFVPLLPSTAQCFSMACLYHVLKCSDICATLKSVLFAK
jgi:hypothetical protein